MKKSIFNFIHATLTGGIIFLLPIVLVGIIIEKAVAILLEISHPLARFLNENFFGFDGSILLAIVLLIIACFFGGLIFRSATAKKAVSKLEDNVLVFLPGYSLIKTITADALGEKVENKLIPVLVQDGEYWNMAFLVEENENLATIFIPDAPRSDAGEVRVVPVTNVKKLAVTAGKFNQSIRNYGKGTLEWINHLNAS